jgi:flagellar biosynthesis protein
MSLRDANKYGAALRYGEDDDIPRIVSTVKGDLVKKLLEIAEMYDIPVYRDPILARLLVKEGDGVYIPDELFPAVAEVLAYCYRIDADFRERVNRRESRL